MLFKFWGERGFPYGLFADAKSLRARARRARLCLRQDSYNAAGFKSPAMSNSWHCAAENKKTPERVYFRGDLPFRHFPDGKCFGAGARRARLCLRQNSHMAPPFKSRRKAKQFAFLHRPKILKASKRMP